MRRVVLRGWANVRGSEVLPSGACEGGYTLVELAVALLLTTLAIAFVAGSALFVEAAAARWRHRVALENATHLALDRLSADLRHAARVTPVVEARADTAWAVVDAAGRRRLYRRAGPALLRDGVPLNRPGAAVVDFSLVGPPIGHAPRSADAGGACCRPPPLVHVRLALAARADTLRVATAVALRPPRPWPPPTPSAP